MASTSSLWSPPSFVPSSSFILSPLSPFDVHNGSNATSGCCSSSTINNNLIPAPLPAPLLSSSPDFSRRRRAQSIMNNSLDLENCAANNCATSTSTSSMTSPTENETPPSSEMDLGFCRGSSHFLLTPGNDNSTTTSANSSGSGAGLPSTRISATAIAHFLQHRTELLVSGQQSTVWSHYTIVSQLRKLENLNLIDKALIKQYNPPIEILTLVQKLIKYNLAMELIDSEDETWRQEQLGKLIKLRCEEVLAMSKSVLDITEHRQANSIERNRIRLAMKELAAEIAYRTRGTIDVSNASKHPARKAAKPLILL